MPTRRVGLTGCCVMLRPHGCCGRRVCCSAGRAAWCAGGRRSFCFLLVAPTDLRPPRGLPARSPSALRALLGASSRSPARLSLIDFARNSSMTHSNFEFASLELQRFWCVSKNDRDKLRAKFGWRWCRCRPLRPSAPRASIGAPSQSPAGHRCPRSDGWVNVRIREPGCPPTGPVRYLVSIRVGRARRAARRSRRSKAPDRDSGR